MREARQKQQNHFRDILLSIIYLSIYLFYYTVKDNLVLYKVIRDANESATFKSVQLLLLHINGGKTK